MRYFTRIAVAGVFICFPNLSLAKEKLVVMDLEAKHGVEQSLAEALSVWVGDMIHGFGEFEVLSKEDLVSIAKRTTMQKQLGACNDTRCLITFGRTIGIKYIVAGALSKLGDTYTISLRLLDTEGEGAGVKRRENKMCKCTEEELLDAVQTVTAMLMDKKVPERQSIAKKAAAKSEKPSNASDLYWTEPTTGMEFVRVVGGCFQMGSPPDEKGRDDDEGPVHEVCVDDFWMGVYEVTNQQYGMYDKNHDSKDYEGKSLNGQDQPVVGVSWIHATSYARWLSGKSGKAFRLPTEAEWEYAARAGTKSSRYWGNHPNGACGYANLHDRTSNNEVIKLLFDHYKCDDGYPVSAPVGRFKPNAFGLYDMLGNVWEWCSDRYGQIYHLNRPANNPKGPSSGGKRVLRGGSWFQSQKAIRAAERDYGPPFGYRTDVGFRLVSPLGRTNALITDDKIAYLGVILKSVTADEVKAQSLPTPKGALIIEVTKGSPADKAGLLPGDIIVEYNGKAINEVKEVPELVFYAVPGSVAGMSIMRNGKKEKVTATLGYWE